MKEAVHGAQKCGMFASGTLRRRDASFYFLDVGVRIRIRMKIGVSVTCVTASRDGLGETLYPKIGERINGWPLASTLREFDGGWAITDAKAAPSES
jgi:hypothetical protein